METWEVWFPAAAANGLLVARARVDPAQVMWLHAAPETVSVVVREGDERILSRAEELKRKGGYLPMTRLPRSGLSISREDRWPTAADLGALVLLPGGEVGTLISWWNADDGSEWRWQIELYNHV